MRIERCFISPDRGGFLSSLALLDSLWFVNLLVGFDCVVALLAPVLACTISCGGSGSCSCGSGSSCSGGCSMFMWK